MKTIQEALSEVRLYDQIRWTFKPGAESVRHVCLNLMAASTRTLNFSMALVNLNVISSLVRKEWCAVMPGILIESACRLANNCSRVDFEDYIFQGNPFADIRRRDFEKRILGHQSSDPDKFAAILLAYFHSLTKLIEICERIDRGEIDFDQPYILDVADDLLYFAVEFSPEPLQSLEQFFRHLEERLTVIH